MSSGEQVALSEAPKVLVVGTDQATPLGRSSNLNNLLQSLEQFNLSVTCQIHRPSRSKHELRSNTEVFFVRTRKFKRNKVNRLIQKALLNKPQRLFPQPLLLKWFDKKIRVNRKQLWRGISGVAPDVVIACGPSALRGIEKIRENSPEFRTVPLIYLRLEGVNSRVRVIEQRIVKSTFQPPFIYLSSASTDSTSSAVRAAIRQQLNSAEHRPEIPQTLGKVPANATPNLMVAPANYAGQAFNWTQALHRAEPATSVNNIVIGENPFDFPASKIASSNTAAYAADYQRFIRSDSSNWTHVILESGRPFLGGQYGNRIEREIDILEETNHKVGLLFHGTDIRNPDSHMERVSSSYYREAPADYVERCRNGALKNRELADRGLPCFVSTPDLLIDLPSATLLPVSIDVDKWVSTRDFMEGHDIPTVFHRPSRSIPPIKGSEVIDPVLHQLEAQGLINYLCPSECTNDEMIRYVHESDIVVDQVRSGFYGVAAVEAMAAKRLVVGYVDPQTRARSPEDPPVVDVSAENFLADMTQIIANVNDYVPTVEQGFIFARKWHDGRASAEVLGKFVNDPVSTEEVL